MTEWGTQRITTAFARTRAAGRAAFMPYWPLGYPDGQTSVEVVTAMAEAGADLIELGVPFSDPLADGPVIQRATQLALARGASVQRCLEMTAAIRQRGVEIPLLMMSYLNPLLAFGDGRNRGPGYFVDAAAAAGADGLIVPDLPPEEAEELVGYCRRQNLATVFLLGPNSPAERIDRVLQQSTGFVYLVTVTGTTGARHSLPPELPAFVRRVQERQTGGASAGLPLPLAAGFGISRREQVVALQALVDGVIVGSALVALAEQLGNPVEVVRRFVAEIAGRN